MSSSFGGMFRVTVFGQSHGAAIGAVVDGVPAGMRLDEKAIGAFMSRRAPGGDLATQRREADVPEILSGVVDGVTCGAPITAVIRNSDARSADYARMRDEPRPMHADWPAALKFRGANDIRGGGQFSGRLTAPLCFAGAVAMQMLAARGVRIGAHIASIGSVSDVPFDPVRVDAVAIRDVASRPFPVIDESAGAAMRVEIASARAEMDSVGGVVECAAVGLPAGIGEPLYDSLESRIAAVVFGIPAVKGIEFGAGFGAASMRGSEHNDPIVMRDGRIETETNRHGGILGGISTGMPLVFRAAFKPTPTIGREQRTVSLSRREETVLAARGRHDPCVVMRAVPCVEAAAACAIADLMLEACGRDRWLDLEERKMI